jgi:ATP-dependent Clp protease ATP-binding subunit ClpA
LITAKHNRRTSIWPFIGITDTNGFKDFLSKKMADALMAEVAKDMSQKQPPIDDILEQFIPLQHEHHEDITTTLTLHQAGMYGDVEGPKTPAFLIIGPPNCGVNALTEALAQISQNMDIAEAVPDADKKPAANRTLVLSGSDYTLEHSTQLLLGSFAEYKNTENGGILTNFLAQPGRKVVVFDKIDLANNDVQNAIADLINGKIDKSRKGQPIDISQTIFIFTAPDIHAHAESETGDTTERKNRSLSEANRRLVASLHDVAIGRIFIFKEDDNNQPEHLIDQILQKAIQSLAKRKITLTITKPVREYLLIAYKKYGAVPDNAIMWYQRRHEKEQIKQGCAGTIDGAFRVRIDSALCGGTGGRKPQDGGVLFSPLA